MHIAVVTGASRGLGRLISHALADKGIDLVIAGRTKEPLLAVAKELTEKGVRVAPVQVDLAGEGAADQIRYIADQFGGADILINNAAMQGPIGDSWTVSADAFNETFRINFTSPAALCRALIPGMIAKGSGWIVNLSGGGATSPRPKFAAYSAAKTALVRYSETLAVECADLKIRVNSVAPGAFRSGMTEALLQSKGEAGEHESAVAERLILQDSGAAEKAAALIAYLVAGHGTDITGKLISALWDDWEHLHEQRGSPPDLYTLRRVTLPVPELTPAH